MKKIILTIVSSLMTIVAIAQGMAFEPETTTLEQASAKAKAGQGEGKAPVKSEMTVVATLQNPKDLQEIDHFLFEVKAESAQGSASQPLASQQYIRLTDIKLMLKGKVTVDLN